MKPHHWIVTALVVLGVAFLTACAPAPKVLGPNAYISVAGGHGSGVHIGNGLILTAAHVAKNAQDPNAVDIRFEDLSPDPVKAEVLWINEAYDVALLRFKDEGKVAAAPLACTVSALGEQLRAVGSPTVFDFLTMWGKVSGKEIAMGPWKSVIPTDMTIIHGMSGGGVFNEKGEVVGISVGTGVMAMGFGATWLRVGLIVPGKTVCDLMGRVA